MEAISVFHIFKIGVGPSSSHTMGPWRATEAFLQSLQARAALEDVVHLNVRLYGSLSKTGIGHGTDRAIVWGLLGLDPVTCDVSALRPRFNQWREEGTLPLLGVHPIPFRAGVDLVFCNETLPGHPNALTFSATLSGGATFSETYYSVGGGFIVREGEEAPPEEQTVRLPYPIARAEELLEYARLLGVPVADVVRLNERTWRTDKEIDATLQRLVDTMEACVHAGCHTPGELPGGLRVVRRAANLNRKLLGTDDPLPLSEWRDTIKSRSWSFDDILRWVSCFALSVNEENASFGRVVTAPTNGAAGVIPAVLLYYMYFRPEATEAGVRDFLLTAGEMGSLFKKGATISAAMGGCQAEIGVSSAMAAAGLTSVLGGTPEQVTMAAEIAMEHHLGLTCDPIGGLVQIPCIERNTMGSIKAITATQIALCSNPNEARVPLDTVIRTMWQTALDMNERYKETAEGGLAVQIPVSVIEC